MNRFCHLPEEVLEDILLRLSPKSISSCKRVCKSWYSLINRKSFVSEHLRRSIDNARHLSSVSLFLKWKRQELTLDEIFTPFYREGDRKLVMSLVTIYSEGDGNGDRLPCVIEEIELPPAPKTEEERFPKSIISTHCNGIICLVEAFHNPNDTIIFFNPTVGEFKFLRTPGLRPKFLHSGSGFGYDSKANDYKYVKLFSPLYHPPEAKAFVYSMRNDSWREIKIDLEGKSCWVKPQGVYCNDVYYWWNVGSSNSEGMVLSFDMSNEEFRTIALPDHVHEGNMKTRKLALWKGSVVFLFSPVNSWFSTTFEMWVMVNNFNGVKGLTYWTKHLTIGPLRCIHSPLTFWKDDELLMETKDGRIVSYNLDTQNLRQLPIRGAVFPGTTFADLYLQTLVSVKKELPNHII